MKKVLFSEDRWDCGDGCCSRHWIDAELWDDGNLLDSKSEILSWSISCYDESQLREAAIFQFDLEGEEFEIES